MAKPVVLMVAEKPSIAHAIAEALNRGKWETRTGVSRSLPVHEVEGEFEGKAVVFRITAVVGHVYSIDFDDAFQSWDRTEPADLFFTATTRKKSANPKARVERHLKTEAKGASGLVLWLDCDREGENICFEVLDLVSHLLPDARTSPFSRPVFRAHFSAVTRAEVTRAMASLGEPNRNEALAVDARQELDLRVGVAFTRFLTKFMTARYADLNTSVVSYGPCQTPTLNFVVSRRDDIVSFTPEPFWTLTARIVVSSSGDEGGFRGSALPLAWDRGRVFDEEVVRAYATLIETEASGGSPPGEGPAMSVTCLDVKTKRRKKPRPAALNTVGLLKVCSAGLGIGPKAAMSIAERLYIQGYISYPRTETTTYPPGFELVETLETQADSPIWGPYVSSILRNGHTKPKPGVDAGDHPPIVPMAVATEEELGGGDTWRVYDYVARHFIATVSPDCVYEAVSAVMALGSETFSTEGARVVDEGFTAVLPSMAPKGRALPVLIPGESYQVRSLDVTEGRTEPPPLLSESELISLMEKHGIGTDASIAVHINNITERGYAKIVGGRRLEPTTLGITLIHGFFRVDPELVTPTVRSSVESQLDLIASGAADKGDLVAHILSSFAAKFAFLADSIALMNELFEANFSLVSASGKPLSRCGRCYRVMKVLYRPNRLHCGMCNETYSLPNNAAIKLFQEKRCPLDDFEMVLVTFGGKKGKQLLVCPYCFNNPPYAAPPGGGGMTCDSCALEGCPHAGESHHLLGPCRAVNTSDDVDESEYGKPCVGSLYLEATSKPMWKAHCSVCRALVHLPEFVYNVRPVPKQDPCSSCGSIQVHIEFHQDKSPIPGMTAMTACIWCDDFIAAQVETSTAVNKHKMFHRGKGKKGRRGRGRKRGKLDHLLRH